MKKVRLTRETLLAINKLRFKNKAFMEAKEREFREEENKRIEGEWWAEYYKGTTTEEYPPTEGAMICTCMHLKSVHTTPWKRSSPCTIEACGCKRFTSKQRFSGVSMPRTLYILPENRLPDERGWTNRFKVRSNSSSSVYIIAQHATGRYWGCSCRGYTTRPAVRHCTHLKDLGIPGGEKPYEVNIDAGGAPMSARDTTATGGAKSNKNTEAGITSLGKRRIDLD